MTKLQIVKITWNSHRIAGEHYGKSWIGILYNRDDYVTRIFVPNQDNNVLDFTTQRIDMEILEEIEIPYNLGEQND